MTERRSDHSRKLHELRLRAEQLHRLGPAELPRRGGNREGNGLLGVAVVRGYLNPVDRISAAGPELSVETVGATLDESEPEGIAGHGEEEDERRNDHDHRRKKPNDDEGGSLITASMAGRLQRTGGKRTHL